jgi:hypothetical protein
MINRKQTIASLKNIKSNSEKATSLTKRVGNLIFNKRVEDLEIEDLRLLIGQNEALDICIPLALEILKSNPMAEGDFFAGDLLKNTLQADIDFWKSNKELKNQLERIFIEQKDYILNYDVSEEIKAELVNSFELFFEI